MKSFTKIQILLLIIVLLVSGLSGKEKYKPTWKSLAKHETPEWFEDAKFGVFIHWGVYSVPAWAPVHKYSEWYPHNMYVEGSETYEYHKENYGDQSEFGYKDFIPMFKAENFDPDQWADIFHKAGIKYVVPTAEHHDGFAMWDSDITEWDAVDMGPKRDLIGDLGVAVRKYGMKYGPSYHRARQWFYYPHKEGWDTNDPKYAGLYGEAHKFSNSAWAGKGNELPNEEFLIDWKKRWEEYRDKYKPDLLWFDGMWGLHPVFIEYTKEIYADYYNKAIEWGKEVGANNKGGTFRTKNKGFVPTEVGDWIEGDYMVQSGIVERKWQNPRGIGRSYGFNINEDPNDYASVNELVDMMIDIVSKNGNLLLDIGPIADGTIPEIQIDRLLGMGKWLDVNGEAIYGTRAWKTFGEQVEPDSVNQGHAAHPIKQGIRFTKKGDVLYAIVLDWPKKKAVNIESLSKKSGLFEGEIKEITMLGSNEEIKWKRTPKKLKVTFPNKKPCEHAFVLKIN